MDFKELTQKEQLKEELLKINPNVTTQDRKDLIEQHNISRATIDWYLQGRVMNNDTAATILKFLSERINERQRIIEEAKQTNNHA
jgi:hypothetical protein